MALETRSHAGAWMLFDKLAELVPHCDAQRSLQSEAESLVINLGQTRLLLFAQSRSSVSTTLLVVVVFWLSTLFVSFGLFAPRNATTIVTLVVAAISVSGALFLILELDRPFSRFLVRRCAMRFPYLEDSSRGRISS
jgi:hypothetical protein